ncbi:calcium-binding protein CML37-like [Durio zibethinus]|uniref:Calcium-binding protein CML37-like n=1 Tax=Durio zibethinus TaxID=66656 RepID=A0A6P6AP45_DURZI|nr:calcium-binding protein CML37-like [Durio zibethinus]
MKQNPRETDQLMDAFTMKSNCGFIPTTSTSASGDSQPKSLLARLRRKLSSRTKSDSKDERRCNSCSSNSSEANSDLQMVFDFLDENGDGKISAQELQRCIRTAGGHLSMDEAEAAVKSSDLDGDGMLGFHEFQALMEGGGSTEEERNKELREAFGMYVLEGSGCITPASLRRMLSRLGESKSINDCKAMIRAFDLNGDGVLSFDEFTVMMQ